MSDEITKLKKFRDAVDSETSAKAEKMLAEAEAECSERLEKARQSAEAKKTAAIDDISKREAQRVTRKASSVRLEAQRKVLLHRAEAADKIFDRVCAKLEKFRADSSYGEWLVKTAKKAAEQYPQEQGKAFLAPADMRFAEMITKATGCHCAPKPEMVLGGIIMCFENINVEIDLSFGCAVEEEKQAFCRSGKLAGC